MTWESKKNWIVSDKVPEDLFNGWPQDSKHISQLLYNRGLLEDKDIRAFLSPQMGDIYPSSTLYDASAASEKILEFAKSGKKIFVYGDFDVDGVCATTILWEFLYRELPKSLGKKVNAMPYIPDRVDEGYGLSEKSIEAMIEKGADLIVTVDCGVRDKSLIQKYIPKIDFIVTDHHQPPEDILENLNYILVHPMFPGHEYRYQKICGSFVALLLAQSIRESLKVSQSLGKETPGLDLVALATVADMMPLVDVNRIVVKHGLEQIRDSKRIGIQNLVLASKVPLKDIDSYHLGYIVGPRINAAGRIGSAMDALRLLTTSKDDVAHTHTQKLNTLNFERQKLTNKILEEAKTQIENESPENKLLFVHGEGWPEGIIGLVAGKIMEEYGKPTIVVTANDNEIRGSARSIPSFDITSAISTFSKYLVRFGGHVQAAGFTVQGGKLELFKGSIVDFANSTIKGLDLMQDLLIDLILENAPLSIELFDSIDYLKPFGFGNRKPMIMLPKAVIVEKRVLGLDKRHLKLSFKANDFGFTTGILFDCLEDIPNLNIDDVVDLAGYIGLNTWNGNTDVQFEIKEWRRSSL